MVVLSAPGNLTRQGLLLEYPGFSRLISFSIRNAIYIIAKFFIWTPGWAVLTIFVSFVSGWFVGLYGEMSQLEKGFFRFNQAVADFTDPSKAQTLIRSPSR